MADGLSDKAQIDGRDELGWALDMLLRYARNGQRDGELDCRPCPKAIARAHARLLRERAEFDRQRALNAAYAKEREHAAAYGLPATYQEALDEVKAWRGGCAAGFGISTADPRATLCNMGKALRDSQELWAKLERFVAADWKLYPPDDALGWTIEHDDDHVVYEGATLADAVRESLPDPQQP